YHTCTLSLSMLVFFFFHAPPTTEIYTLSLHDALPISRLPKAESVARSVSVYARRSSARPSVAPMPWPDSMYQGAAGVTPATFQRASSTVWVPDLSPRDTKRAPAAAILPSAATTLLSPAILAGSASGPTSTKSLYM